MNFLDQLILSILIQAQKEDHGHPLIDHEELHDGLHPLLELQNQLKEGHDLNFYFVHTAHLNFLSILRWSINTLDVHLHLYLDLNQ